MDELTPRGLDSTKHLFIDIKLKDLVKIEDLYGDQTTLYKTLFKGERSTASPFYNSLVDLRVKL
jgi:hypothetical protein